MIEINGKKYVKRERKSLKISPRIASILTMAAVMGGGSFAGFGGSGGPPPNVDIVKEYELIINKKSKLSRSERDWVQYQFKDKYKEIKEENLEVD